MGWCATCQCPVIDPCGRLQNLNQTSSLCALTRSGPRALRITGMTAANLQSLPCFSCSLCGTGFPQRPSIPTSSLLPPSHWMFATANPRAWDTDTLWHSYSDTVFLPPSLSLHHCGSKASCSQPSPQISNSVYNWFFQGCILPPPPSLSLTPLCITTHWWKSIF